MNILPQIAFCFVIFGCKVIEIVLSSLKTVFLVKNKRSLSVILALIEALVWAFAISGIIGSLTDNIAWLLSYCIGYTAGYYLGSTIEQKLAIGTTDVRMIMPTEYVTAVEELLQNYGLGYFVQDGRGARGAKSRFEITLPRKSARTIRKAVEEICDGNVFVTNVDIMYMHGGYTTKLKARGN